MYILGNRLTFNEISANSSVPSTPVGDLNKAPNFQQEPPKLDAYERALRQRKQEVSLLPNIVALEAVTYLFVFTVSEKMTNCNKS